MKGEVKGGREESIHCFPSRTKNLDPLDIFSTALALVCWLVQTCRLVGCLLMVKDACCEVQ